MKQAICICVTVSVLWLGGCGSDEETKAKEEGPKFDVGSMMYADLHRPGKLCLMSNGEWQEAGQGFLKLRHSAFAQLVGDSLLDGAVILLSNSGGDELYTELRIIENRGLSPVARGWKILGDRVKFASFEIEPGAEPVLRVGMKVHGKQDSLCCPTVDTMVRFRVSGDSLVEL